MVGDPYIEQAIAAAGDPACSEDLAVDEGDDVVAFVHTAAERLQHCGFVVVRKVMNRTFMQSFRAPFTDYVRGLTNGSINTNGRTTHNEVYFIHKLAKKRWELLLPRSFASHELFGGERLSAVMSHFGVLGAEYVLHSLGAAISEGGSLDLHWHRDSETPYALGSSAGTDLPPHAVTLLSPLLDMQPNHGRTEFCVGSHHLTGLIKPFVGVEDPLLEPLLDDSSCPAQLRQVQPLLGVGDAVLFDYKLMHRAMRNTSPQLRALLYFTFSRPWFKDVGNFDAAQVDVVPQSGERDAYGMAPVASAAGTPLDALSEDDRQELVRLTRQARFAEPYVPDKKASAAPAAEVLEDIKNAFHPMSVMFEEQGYVLEDEDDEEVEEVEEVEDTEDKMERGDDDKDADEAKDAGEPRKSANCGIAPTTVGRRCPIRALFSQPMIPVSV